MDDEVKRGRGRPTNAALFGDAAGDALSMLLQRVRSEMIRDGTTKPATVVDYETGRRSVSQPDGIRISPNRRRPAAPDAPVKPIKKGTKKGTRKTPRHLRTSKERVWHEWGPQSVERRDHVHKRLRKIGCMEGDHVERFIRDYEACGSDLRSRGFDIGSGGGGLPFPVVKVDAAKRLVELQKFLGNGEFDLVVAVVIYGATATELHAHGGEEHAVIRREIKDAVDRMAGFYTPGRTMRKRTWDAAIRKVQEAEREVAK